MNEAIINYKLSLLKKDKIVLEIISEPFPLTEKIKKFEGSASGIVASFIYAIGFSFIPASIITFTVKERTDKIKQ